MAGDATVTKLVAGSGNPADEPDKRVDTRYPVMPELLDRWSPRSFSDRQPEAQALASMFEAARLAPSAHNTQPVRFLLGRRDQDGLFSDLFSCLEPHNQEWAHSVPVLLLATVMKNRFSQPRGEFVPYPHAMHDLGLAVMSLIVQGQHLGLHCHPMAAFDPDKAQELFSIPSLFAPGLMIAIGYLGPPDALPPDLQTLERRARTRRPLEELVFEGGWGQASPLFAGEVWHGRKEAHGQAAAHRDHRRGSRRIGKVLRSRIRDEAHR